MSTGARVRAASATAGWWLAGTVLSALAGLVLGFGLLFVAAWMGVL